MLRLLETYPAPAAIPRRRIPLTRGFQTIDRLGQGHRDASLANPLGSNKQQRRWQRITGDRPGQQADQRSMSRDPAE